MGLYNFKVRFAPKIESGEKTHTIRPERKHVEKVGNTVHLYTGLRQRGRIIQKLESGDVKREKVARLLGRFPCIKVEGIQIEELPAMFLENAGPVIRIDGEALGRDECEAFARRDGFDNFADMMEFWRGRLPFRGHIIHWRFSK